MGAPQNGTPVSIQLARTLSNKYTARLPQIQGNVGH